MPPKPHRRRNAIAFAAFALAAAWASIAPAQESLQTRIVPNALLSIDRNRGTVVDRIVSEWGAELARANGGLSPSQLRETLSAMRSDYLLAASVAGSLEGLREVLASSLDGAAPLKAPLAKALGDSWQDLVYTPVTPCRIVDTRYSGGPLAAGQTRNWFASNPNGTFAGQGGSSSNCQIWTKPAAVLANITAFNTTAGPAFLLAWPYGQSAPNAATLNWTASGQQIANAVILSLCVFGCTPFDFSTTATSQTDMTIDVMGYFAAPPASALNCTELGYGGTIYAQSDTTLWAPSCGNGYTQTQMLCEGAQSNPAVYLVETNILGCVFRNLSAGSNYQGMVRSKCCQIPGR